VNREVRACSEKKVGIERGVFSDPRKLKSRLSRGRKRYKVEKEERRYMRSNLQNTDSKISNQSSAITPPLISTAPLILDRESAYYTRSREEQEKGGGGLRLINKQPLQEKAEGIPDNR